MSMSIFVFGGSKECKIGACCHFLIVWKLSHTIQIWEGSWIHIQYDMVLDVFLVRLISLFLMTCMCLIWLNMHMFFWRLVMIMSLSLWSVITCTLLHFPVSSWLDMASKTCWTVFGSFMLILRIQKLVLFLSGNEWLHGLLFSDWDMYNMLWCSHYCVQIPMGLPLRGKLKFTSNISSLIKGYLRGRFLMLEGLKYFCQE